MSLNPNNICTTSTGLSNHQLKYTMFLDDVDIGLLPIHFKKEELNTSIPLWSCKSNRWDSYYEFELIAELRDDDENEDVVDEANSSRYTCHICNTTVPNTFTQVHNGSTKHKTCLAIAEQALERIKKNLSSGDTPCMKENDTIYYCDACSTALNCKNRDEHERSKEHLLSLLHEKLHQSFLKMYSDKDSNKMNYVADVTNLLNQHRKAEELVQRLENQPQPPIEEVTKCARLVFAGDEPLDLNSYIKLLDCNTSKLLYTLSATDNDHILINLNGSHVTVSVDNFHSFYVLESLDRCRLCDDIVYNKEAHVLMPMHMKRLCSPILDKHCIRLLNGTWDHCIICNVSIQNIDGFVHAYCDEQHKSLLQRALEPTAEEQAEVNNNTSEEANSNLEAKSGNQDLLVANYKKAHSKVIVTSENGELYCTACEVDLPTGKNTHQCGLHHRQTLWRKGYRSILHTHMKRTRAASAEVQCKICNLKLKYCTDEIDEHIESELHDSNYRRLLELNQMRKQEDHKSVCEACGTTVLYMDELDHIDSKKHLKKLKKSKKLSKNNANTLIKGDDEDDEDMALQDDAKLPTQVEEEILKKHYLIDDSNHQAKCKVCDMYIENDAECITTHLEHPGHVDNYNRLLVANSIKPCREGLMFKFYCDFCVDLIMAEYEYDHICSDGHREMKNFNSELEVQPTAGNDTKATEYLEKPTTDSVASNEEINTLSSDYYSCDICLITIPNRVSSIKSHFEGVSHRINLDQKFTCKSKASTHDLIEVTSGKVSCKVCDVNLPNTSHIQQHIKGKSHRSKYNAMLSRNGVKFIHSYNKYYCDICFVSIINTKEYDHINSANHKISLEYKFQVDD